MEIKYKSNLAAGIVSIILGVICIILVPLQIAEDYSATYGITSRTIPCAIGVLWIVCGVVLLIQSLILKKRHSENTDRRKRIKSISIYGHAAYLFNSVQNFFILIFLFAFHIFVCSFSLLCIPFFQKNDEHKC